MVNNLLINNQTFSESPSELARMFLFVDSENTENAFRNKSYINKLSITIHFRDVYYTWNNIAIIFVSRLCNIMHFTFIKCSVYDQSIFECSIWPLNIG